jgi:hypothetical protein
MPTLTCQLVDLGFCRPDATAGGEVPRDEMALMAACHQDHEAAMKADAKAAKETYKQVGITLTTVVVL